MLLSTKVKSYWSLFFIIIIIICKACWDPCGTCSIKTYQLLTININPFLPSLVTAVLACWPEGAARQLQKADCLNQKGYNLSWREHNVFKLREQVKNWIVISIMLILSLLGGYFPVDHVTLFKRLFWSHRDTKHYVLSHFLTYTPFIC